MKYRTFLFQMICLLAIMLFSTGVNAQLLENKLKFNRQDSLRGMNGAYRQKWDVLHYEISVKPDFVSKTIEGKNTIRFTDKGAGTMQIDLQEPMILDSVVNENGKYNFTREGNVYWLKFRNSESDMKPATQVLTFYFHGKPVEGKRPPWDGGWIWRKDKSGNPWMSVACQGLGASVWYPCKDIQGDEPDNGAILHITVPDSLTGVGNGRMTAKKGLGNGTTTYSWEVKSPINNYCIVPSIGKYVHFGETFMGEKGKLEMDYWVLDYNLEKAKKQFTDATRMMKAFEHWFGPYPFYEDGFKLIESPHLGMEHQSGTAYGNGYQNGYLGRDLSGTGWGMKWDFIIVHEAGHEWFANNITTKDIADMWVHEGFTNYSETLFTGYFYGDTAANAYVKGTRKIIANDKPIIGHYNVNKEGSSDMYYKGGNLLHTIRNVIDNDEKFRQILRGLNKTFYHQTVTTADVENYISTQAKIDFSKVFDQYLRTTNIPQLEYKVEDKKIAYRWTNTVPGFDLPLKVSYGKMKDKWLKPTTEWKSIKMKLKDWDDKKSFIINENFYVNSKLVL